MIESFEKQQRRLPVKLTKIFATLTVVICVLIGLCQNAQATYCTKNPPMKRTGFLGLDFKEDEKDVWEIKSTKNASVPTTKTTVRQPKNGFELIKIKF